MQSYYATIGWLDDSVGQLVDRVRDLGLERRTLFLFVTDNGWDPRPAESPDVLYLGGPHGKLSLYELGLRTPVVLRWLGGIEPRAQRAELVSFTDVFATLADYAGAPIPEDRPGHSLRPLLEGSSEWPRQQLIGWMPTLRGQGLARGFQTDGFFWRDRRWHYLNPLGHAEALYDLDADPEEMHDVIDAHPEVATRARNAITAWFRRVAP